MLSSNTMGLSPTLTCELCCGHHSTGCCPLMKDVKTVENNKALSLARLTLPESLELIMMADGTETVVTKTNVAKNTMFGPFEAKTRSMLHPAITFPLKVFVSSSSPHLPGYYYLDTTGEDTSNWMRFVRSSVCGSTKGGELNLLAYQVNENVFYMSCRDIAAGEQLKVGYSPAYAKRLGLPIPRTPQPMSDSTVLSALRKKEKEASAALVTHVPQTVLGVPDDKQAGEWTCHTCNVTGFESVAQYASHLRRHYRDEMVKEDKAARSERDEKKKRQCLVCLEEFSKKKFEGHSCKVGLDAQGESMGTSQDLDATFDPDTASVNIHLDNGVGVLNESLDNLLRQLENNENYNESDDEMMYSIDPHDLDKVSPTKDPVAAPTKLDTFDTEFLFEQGDDLSCFSTSTRIDVNGDDDDDFLATNGTAFDEGSMFLFDEAKKDEGARTTNVFEGQVAMVNGFEGRAVTLNGFDKLTSATNGFDDGATMLNGFDDGTVERAKKVEDMFAKFAVELEASGLSAPIQLVDNMASRVSPVMVAMDGAAYEYGLDERVAMGGDTLADTSFSMVINELPNAETMEGIDDLSFLPNTDVEMPSDKEDQDESTKKEAETKSKLTCDICAKEFTNKYGLYRHLQKHTGEFACPTCFAVFARKESLMKHVCVKRNHLLNKSVVSPVLKCELCDKEFDGTSPKRLNQHMESVHMGKWKCDRCHQSWSSNHYLKTHPCKMGPAPVETFRCPHCLRPFTSPYYMRKHQRRVHGTPKKCATCGKQVVGNDAHGAYCAEAAQLRVHGVAKCPECYDMFVDVRAFREHVLVHTHKHTCATCEVAFITPQAMKRHRCGTLQCDKCSLHFITFPELKTHSSSHGVADWHCFECGFSFYTETGLSSHECASQGFGGSKKSPPSEPAPQVLKAYVCEICGISFQTSAGLVGHKEAYHSEPKFKCVICDKRFHRADLLDLHLTVHEDPKIPCPRPDCTMLLKNAKTLAMHVRVHEDVQRPFPCDLCPKSYLCASMLRRHVRIRHDARTEQRTLSCTHCHKTFKSRFYLAQHEKSHAEGKLFRCTVEGCSKYYVTDRLCKAHMRDSHSDGYACVICNKKITTKASLKRHYVTIHRTEKAKAVNFVLLSEQVPNGLFRADEAAAGNVAAVGNVAAAGNVATDGNVATAGNIAAAGNVATAGNVSTSGNVATAGNIATAGNVGTYGNVATARNVATAGNVGTYGNVATASHIATAGIVATVAVAGNVAASVGDLTSVNGVTGVGGMSVSCRETAAQGVTADKGVTAVKGAKAVKGKTAVKGVKAAGKQKIAKGKRAVKGVAGFKEKAAAKRIKVVNGTNCVNGMVSITERTAEVGSISVDNRTFATLPSAGVPTWVSEATIDANTPIVFATFDDGTIDETFMYIDSATVDSQIVLANEIPVNNTPGTVNVGIAACDGVTTFNGSTSFVRLVTAGNTIADRSMPVINGNLTSANEAVGVVTFINLPASG